MWAGRKRTEACRLFIQVPKGTYIGFTHNFIEARLGAQVKT